MDIIQGIVADVLIFVLFFGIAFILNMLLRMTWIMSFIFPIVVILIIDDVSFMSYLTEPDIAFPALGAKVTGLKIWDILILLAGFLGTIISGISIKMLRKNGYQMF